MDKAAKRALEKYPVVKRASWSRSCGWSDPHEGLRRIFRKGYHQAEQDLALTGEDIRNISKILHQLEAEDWCLELIFDEAARIFNEQRKK